MTIKELYHGFVLLCVAVRFRQEQHIVATRNRIVLRFLAEVRDVSKENNKLANTVIWFRFRAPTSFLTCSAFVGHPRPNALPAFGLQLVERPSFDFRPAWICSLSNPNRGNRFYELLSTAFRSGQAAAKRI